MWDDMKQAMLLLLSLDPNTHLRFSEVTGQWYVHADLHTITIQDSLVSSVLHHDDTPHGAIMGLLQQIQSLPDDTVLVPLMGSESRRYLRWNGAAFAEVARGPHLFR